MKKRIIASMMALMLIGLCIGCESSDQTASESSGESNETEETQEESETKDTATLSGTLEVWSCGEELDRFVEGFNKIYPDITVNINVIPNEDFIAKLTPALASESEAPDVFTGESDYVKYLVDSGYWDDLEADPYNADVSDVWEYVVSVGTDDDGVLRALSFQASPGCIFYRRDMAKEVLGTDEPDEVSELLSSNDKMMEVAAELKDKGIKMFASWQDIMNMQFSNRSEPWVVDDKLVIDDSMLDFMDMAKMITEDDYDLGVDPWAPEWSAAVESDDTFCYVLPSWGYQSVIKPAADSTIGDWGICEGPVPYVKGGTWLGIYKDSPNKDLAWAFVEYCCLNSEAQEEYAKEYGEYVSLKSADEELAKEDGEEILGGQNLFAFYNAEMEKLPADLMTPYDGTINDAFTSATKEYATGVLSRDEAIQQFKEDVANAYPEIDIN